MEFSNQHVRQFSGSVVVDMDESDDEEVEEWLLEQELAKEGLYRGASLARVSNELAGR
jgi:predicted Zn-dependent protease with MMP-like domain